MPGKCRQKVRLVLILQEAGRGPGSIGGSKLLWVLVKWHGFLIMKSIKERFNYDFLRKQSFVYGHTTLNTPNLVWSQKLSRVGPGWEKAIFLPTIWSTQKLNPNSNVLHCLAAGTRETRHTNIFLESYSFHMKYFIIFIITYLHLCKPMLLEQPNFNMLI